jgi:UDPglucose--hexose-1-phosphate uridylyltransferase
MPITFETLYDTMTLIRAGKKEEIPFEIRTDPLTGRTGRVFNLPYQPPKTPNAEETFKRSEGIFCPFCPENIETSTPRFPEELVPGGKIQIGRATLLPNVLPLDRYVGIAVLSPALRADGRADPRNDERRISCRTGVHPEGFRG